MGAVLFVPCAWLLARLEERPTAVSTAAAARQLWAYHEKLLALIRAKDPPTPPDELAACREVQRALQEVETQALQAVKDAVAEMERQGKASLKWSCRPAESQ